MGRDFADAEAPDARVDLGSVDAGPSPPVCAPTAFDPGEFVTRCAAGAVAPVQLLGESRWPEVVFDGLQFGAFAVGSGTLHHYDAEGSLLGLVSVPGAAVATLARVDCGFAVAGGELHQFDRDLVEFGAHPPLDAAGPGPLLTWDGERFATFVGYGGLPPVITFLARDGTVLAQAPGEWIYSPTAVLWDGAQYIVAGEGGPPPEVLTGLDRDGHRTWLGGVEFNGRVNILGTASGFLLWGGGWVAAYDHGGASLGPPVAFAADSFASHGVNIIAVYVVNESDGTRSLLTQHFDARANPVGAAQELLHASSLPLTQLHVLWAGYSYAVAFGGGYASGKDRRVFLLRVCP